MQAASTASRALCRGRYGQDSFAKHRAARNLPARTRQPASRLTRAFQKDDPHLASKPKPGLRNAGQEGTVPDYRTSPMDNVLLSYFRQAIAHELGEQDREDPGFPGTARLVKRLQHSTRNGKELQERGTRIMRSLLPAMLVRAFGAFLGILPNWFTARHAASAMVLTTNWLVGPSAVNDAPSDLLPDDRSMVPTSVAAALMERDLKPAGYRQGVLVKRCRVLEETKCASVCLNICQGPTQKFFTEDVGLPLTMLPNYDTFECQFVFGRDPPPPLDCDIFHSPCFKQCSSPQRSQHPSCDVVQYVVPPGYVVMEGPRTAHGTGQGDAA